MNVALYPFMVLGACGFMMSVIAHIMALAGISLPGGDLHIGIFVVWIPTVLVAHRITRYSNSKDFWKTALVGCPAWMRRVLWFVFGYAILNFVLFIISTSSHPKPAGAAPPSVIRGFSGHWMVFYGAAFATLYSAIHAPYLFHERKCPQGHGVTPTARFCPECGYHFPDYHENT